MPILVIAVVALALFVVVGVILFTAGMIERRQAQRPREARLSQPSSLICSYNRLLQWARRAARAKSGGALSQSNLSRDHTFAS